MNILQVIPELDAGGAERTTLEVAEAIIAEGGKAYVASRGGRMEAELDAMGAELIRMDVKSKNPITIWNNAARLARRIIAKDIDVIHARSRAPAWSAMWAARRTNIAYVTTYHGTYNAKTDLKRWYNSVMAKGDIVIANSTFIADHIHREYPGLVERLEIIPRGVDLKLFDPDKVTQSRVAALRRSWDVTPDKPVILLPARLTRWKGQITAIEALSRLNERPVLVLAGDSQGRDDYVKDLKHSAGRHGVDIRLPGHITDMPAALMASSLVLTPSIEPEAFGRTAAEAQAMGTPVIASDHGGAREVIEEGVTGWRVPPGDPDRLAEAISKALALDSETRGKMATAARNRVESRFSKASLQQKTLRVYKELIK